MSRKGECWKNSVAESFFAAIKRELIDRQSWTNKQPIKPAIVEWIDSFYNRQR
ncbi:MAG: transposase [Oligoflexus sp.]|nr:transposase [Oligoflexus sp.]